MKYEEIANEIENEKEILKATISEYEKKISNLPKGSLYFRDIKGRSFVYRSKRVGSKIISEYVGPVNSEKGRLAYDQEMTKRIFKNNLLKAKEELKLLSKKIKVIEPQKTQSQDITEIAVGMSMVDAKAPSKRAKVLTKLYELGIIDFETCKFAIMRPFQNEK